MDHSRPARRGRDADPTDEHADPTDEHADPTDEHADPAVEAPPAAAATTAEHRPLGLAGVTAVGFVMGTADLVPGFSGGTVALVTGIYPRLVASIRQGARFLSLLVRGRLRAAGTAFAELEWGFVICLLGGLLVAVYSLATSLTHLLETYPVQMEAMFLGLVVGATVLAWRGLRRPAMSHLWLALTVGAVAFVALGLRTGDVNDPSLWVYFGAGAIAICAMILPGISGAFLLLMLGMYANVIGAVSDRDLVVVGVVGLGCVVGLAAFSTLLTWLLAHYHDLLLAAMVGLMLGSIRVLWPWPPGPDGVGDVRLGAPVMSEVPLALALAVVACAAVLGVGALARRKAALT